MLLAWSSALIISFSVVAMSVPFISASLAISIVASKAPTVFVFASVTSLSFSPVAEAIFSISSMAFEASVCCSFACTDFSLVSLVHFVDHSSASKACVFALTAAAACVVAVVALCAASSIFWWDFCAASFAFAVSCHAVSAIWVVSFNAASACVCDSSAWAAAAVASFTSVSTSFPDSSAICFACSAALALPFHPDSTSSILCSASSARDCTLRTSASSSLLAVSVWWTKAATCWPLTSAFFSIVAWFSRTMALCLSTSALVMLIV